jgi:hypothetical protein
MLCKQTRRLIRSSPEAKHGREARTVLSNIRYRRSDPVAVVLPSEAALRGTTRAFNEKLLPLGVLGLRRAVRSSGSLRSCQMARRKTGS